MRKSLLNKSCFLLLLSVMMIVCSCADNKNKSTRLTGTVWIHQFTEEEGVNEAAYALSFGKDKVELYELDKNMHVKELRNQFDYKIIKGKTIRIGNRAGTLGDNYLYFRAWIFYRSDKKFSDLLK